MEKLRKKSCKKEIKSKSTFDSTQEIYKWNQSSEIVKTASVTPLDGGINITEKEPKIIIANNELIDIIRSQTVQTRNIDEENNLFPVSYPRKANQPRRTVITTEPKSDLQKNKCLYPRLSSSLGQMRLNNDTYTHERMLTASSVESSETVSINSSEVSSECNSNQTDLESISDQGDIESTSSRIDSTSTQSTDSEISESLEQDSFNSINNNSNIKEYLSETKFKPQGALKAIIEDATAAEREQKLIRARNLKIATKLSKPVKRTIWNSIYKFWTTSQRESPSKRVADGRKSNSNLWNSKRVLDFNGNGIQQKPAESEKTNAFLRNHANLFPDVHGNVPRPSSRLSTSDRFMTYLSIKWRRLKSFFSKKSSKGSNS